LEEARGCARPRYLMHAVPILGLQGQARQAQRGLLMAGEAILQKVLPQLEVVLVAAQLVPDSKRKKPTFERLI